MIPWEKLAETDIPGEEEKLTLFRRGDEYAIRQGTLDLMNSRLHHSEEELARMVVSQGGVKGKFIVGGLGMGFTLRAALDSADAEASFLVVELLKDVVEWNKKWFAPLANRPLEDPRVKVVRENVFSVLKAKPGFYHGIMLDVDNGPEAFTSKSNDSLYTRKGIGTVHNALRKNGVLGVWSANGDIRFRERLQKSGFDVEEHRVFARPGNKGKRHTIWIARKES